ncbi:MAG TPA: prepilin-type N-terminal cleavage/methylation domain-containing protein [Candidatus Xenobia bacterium]|jgi:prepilin-type N-terminal cleavage/methylation domain-containing protein
MPVTLRGVRRGFSLAEIIFAMSLFSLVVLGLFQLYPTSLLTIRQSEHRMQANSLALGTLDSYRAYPFSTCSNVAATAVNEANAVLNAFQTPSGSPSYGIDGVQYWTETIASSSPDASGTIRLVDMKVTCYWDERSDQTTSGWDDGLAGGKGYRQWHHLTQELYIINIHQ